MQSTQTNNKSSPTNTHSHILTYTHSHTLSSNHTSLPLCYSLQTGQRININVNAFSFFFLGFFHLDSISSQQQFPTAPSLCPSLTYILLERFPQEINRDILTPPSPTHTHTHNTL